MTDNLLSTQTQNQHVSSRNSPEPGSTDFEGNYLRLGLDVRPSPPTNARCAVEVESGLTGLGDAGRGSPENYQSL
jgi:hypothetical protein